MTLLQPFLYCFVGHVLSWFNFVWLCSVLWGTCIHTQHMQLVTGHDQIVLQGQLDPFPASAIVQRSLCNSSSEGGVWSHETIVHEVKGSFAYYNYVCTDTSFHIISGNIY